MLFERYVVRFRKRDSVIVRPDHPERLGQIDDRRICLRRYLAIVFVCMIEANQGVGGDLYGILSSQLVQKFFLLLRSWPAGRHDLHQSRAFFGSGQCIDLFSSGSGAGIGQ